MIRKILASFILSVVALSANAWPFLFGETSNLAVTAIAQNITLPAFTPTGGVLYQSDSLAQTNGYGLRQYVLTAIGSQTIFVRFDGTPSTVANAMPVLPNTQVVISVPIASTAISVIAAGTGSTLYVTAGFGQ